ncbi:c-type cytochrome [Fulvivirgaceae bacterium BMA10]|uniref:C-type cytochrome n=1 Tax=Splendidivirga corallicola TaxID=3051826 RepID=A0ABT8KJG4_9BACT|nr:c-type cytochrome [Fulvivirgaceae bacterium BMA10]
MLRQNIGLILLVVILLSSGIYTTFINTDTKETIDHNKQEVGLSRESIPDSPIIHPEEALKTFQLQPGFEIDLVASEPLIHDPVALTFDNQGRIWVVEMKGYMPNTRGEGEDFKNGSIKILEDTNGDGKMDLAKDFLKNLVLPRAICLAYDGLLYAEPPNLWFVEIKNDTPVNKVLVDPEYAVGGNVEHQPNGLLLALDNWIYSAKSSKRYRRINGRWLIEKTEFRGQWGISQDNFGHLFYNTNSNQLRGDFIPPSYVARNNYLDRSISTNVEIVPDQRVYPIRPNTGINRGYLKGMLTDSLRLTNFTAACGPVIYRGHKFPDGYEQNAFVAEPAANLIKRNILTLNDLQIRGEQAYSGKEFLASTDERFRPVNLHNGPDGNLYIVDMYRGVIQHVTYLTDYLKNEIKTRSLEKPIGLGRLYRVRPKTESVTDHHISFDVPNQQLIAYLEHENGWIRDRAQQLLIQKNDLDLIPRIRENILENDHTLAQIHSIWVLEGMQALDLWLLSQIPALNKPEVLVQAIKASEYLINHENAKEILAIYNNLVDQGESKVALQVALSLGGIGKILPKETLPILLKIARAEAQDPIVGEAILCSLSEYEEDFLNDALAGDYVDIDFLKRLARIIAKKNKDNKDQQLAVFQNGGNLFKKVCQTCHGDQGQGIISLGPPLAGSEWVTGNKERLISIVLFGLEGPVEVNGKLYQSPEIAPIMPGLFNNESLTNQEIAEILNFIRHSWGNNAERIDPKEINIIRNKYPDGTRPFTQADFEDAQ